MQEYWELALSASKVSILSEELIAELGGSKVFFCENELAFGDKTAGFIYKAALKNLKKNRSIGVSADLALLINGELSLAWNIKSENLSSLDLATELHFNKLSLMLHRKAAVAWEFRKKLIKLHSELPRNELEMVLELAELHKQNYYLWEYRRWLWQNYLVAEEKQKELKTLMEYCEIHPSDSSSFHYLAECLGSLNGKKSGYLWISDLCKKYYGENGLYAEKYPPGYETLNLFRAKMRENDENDEEYKNEQIRLGRNIRYLYVNN